MAETNTENTQDIGPSKISFSTFLLKVLAGGAGGSIGALVLLVIFLLTSSLLTPLTSGKLEDSISPIFVFLLLILIFLSSTISNLISVFLLSLTENEKYKRKKTAIYQVFIFSVLIFVLMAPVYFVASAANPAVVPLTIALHIIISAQVSSLVLEMVSNYRYSIVSLYGITFSIIVSALVLFGIYGIIDQPYVLVVLALPVVWGSVAIVQTLTTIIYGWIANIYDKDFLSTQTVYGDDYGEEVEEEAPARAEDEEGADFLRHN